jgi:hypothetical protein
MLARWPKPGLRLRATGGAVGAGAGGGAAQLRLGTHARSRHRPSHVMSAAVLVSVGHAKGECVLLVPLALGALLLALLLACCWALQGRWVAAICGRDVASSPLCWSEQLKSPS